jgi:hypothetical protein
MTIKQLEEPGADAATNGLRFRTPLEDVAIDLFRWQKKTHGSLIPASFPLPDVDTTATNRTAADTTYFQRRDAAIQTRLRQAGADAARRKKRAHMSYLICGGHVWHLVQSERYKDTVSESLVRENAGFYIKLILQKELIEQSGLLLADSRSTHELGPGVYLLHKIGRSGRKVQLMEALFDVIPKFQRMLCNIRCAVVGKNAGPENLLRIGQVDAGYGYTTEVVTLDTASVTRLDARESPVPGINLRKTSFRQSRLYYLNVLTEFAMSVFRQAGVQFERELFVATHVLPNAYLPLASIARLHRTLVVANATTEPTPSSQIPALSDLKGHFPRGFHTYGGPVDFEQPIVIQTEVPEIPAPELNYLFLNGTKAGEGSVLLYDNHDENAAPVKAADAYDRLESESTRTDAYTRIKYDYLINRDAFRVCLQGLDESPTSLQAISQDPKILQTRREKLKRCLVELSLKEIVAGVKPFPTSAFPDASSSLTLIGTRSLKTRQDRMKTLIATVSVDISNAGIWVRDTSRTPWAVARSANLSFVERYPFLLDGDRKVRDNQFWVVDATTAKRLRVWSGNFVPKIILNNRYAGIEDALASQEQHGGRANKRAFYSKSKTFNILPYYISLRDESRTVRNDQVGQLIALQDCGAWIRAFIPPADGIDGTGSSMSGMRDIMLYDPSGEAITNSLLDEPLLQIYLRTMTNGILVSGGNSKMSILEKFVRLVLEN